MKKIGIACVLWYLKLLAKIALFLHHPVIIGIGGSAGKSSARNATFAALKNNLRVKSIAGNSETGIPLGLLGVVPDGYDLRDWLIMLLQAPFGLNYLARASYIIVEMGIDDPLPPKNMEYLLSFIKPDIAVSLNVSATHTMQFEKILPKKPLRGRERLEYLIQAIAEEDSKIITRSGCKTAIYNRDDEHLNNAVKKAILPHSTTLYTFGKRGATVSYEDFEISLSGTRFMFDVLWMGKKESIVVTLDHFLLPRVYEETIAASLLASMSVGVSLQDTVSSLEKNFTLPKGRSSLFQGINGSEIIDSTYNSSRRSVLSFLDLAAELKKKTKREVLFLCGDMNELGDEASQEHEQLIPEILRTVDYLYCVGPETKKHIIPRAQKSRLKDAQWFVSAREAGGFLKDHLKENVLILAKGSQNQVYLEEALKQILLDPSDAKNLCRQEGYWMTIKEKYFKKQSSSKM